jgi:hypothetical protein
MTPRSFLHHRKMELRWGRLWPVAGAIAALCVWITLAGASASAQSNGLGTITGTVTDPAGSSIVGAKLVVTDVATNVNSNSVTNGTGYFEVDSLVPGKYKIIVTAPGFETLLREGITLEAGGADTVVLQLKTGSVSQTVTIIADVTLLNTQDGSFGQTITTQELEAYPASV